MKILPKLDRGKMRISPFLHDGIREINNYTPVTLNSSLLDSLDSPKC